MLCRQYLKKAERKEERKTEREEETETKRKKERKIKRKTERKEERMKVRSITVTPLHYGLPAPQRYTTHTLSHHGQGSCTLHYTHML